MKNHQANKKKNSSNGNSKFKLKTKVKTSLKKSSNDKKSIDQVKKSIKSSITNKKELQKQIDEISKNKLPDNEYLKPSSEKIKSDFIEESIYASDMEDEYDSENDDNTNLNESDSESDSDDDVLPDEFDVTKKSDSEEDESDLESEGQEEKGKKENDTEEKKVPKEVGLDKESNKTLFKESLKKILDVTLHERIKHEHEMILCMSKGTQKRRLQKIKQERIEEEKVKTEQNEKNLVLSQGVMPLTLETLEREEELRRIARRGVVILFNKVHEAKTNLEKEKKEKDEVEDKSAYDALKNIPFTL